MIRLRAWLKKTKTYDQRQTGLIKLSFLKTARETNPGYALVAICVALKVQKMLLYTWLT